MPSKRTKLREIDSRRIAGNGEVRWQLAADGSHVVTILDSTHARVLAELGFSDGRGAREAFDHPALHVAPVQPAIPTEPVHEPESSRAPGSRISGKYAVFACERAHEWAGVLPSFYSDDWPRCPTCGKPAYLCEPGWHRVHS